MICKRRFERLAPRSVCCGKDCRKLHNLQKMNDWHRTHRRQELEYRTVPRRRRRWAILRRERRKNIYDIWGRNNDWTLAERDAERILSLCGYTNVIRFDDMPTCPFDIVAVKNEGFVDRHRVVFQVTTRTHTSKKRAHKLAKALGLHHMVIFISPIAKLFIIKDLTDGGLAELNEGEVKSASRYV